MSVDRLRFDESLEESPRITGSRVSVIQVYEMHILKGLTVNEIAERLSGIDVDDVRQAISYARSHPDEIRSQATSGLTKQIVERQGRFRAAKA